MTVTSPATVARATIIAALNAEFTGEVVFVNDRLHDAMGFDGVYGAVYPAVEETQPRQANVWDVTVVVQLFNHWDKQVNPAQVVDPTVVEVQAERLKRALRVPSSGNTPHMWYFNVVQVEYPPDPTGNVSRLEAVVVATSQNSAIVETVG